MPMPARGSVVDLPVRLPGSSRGVGSRIAPGPSVESESAIFASGLMPTWLEESEFLSWRGAM